MKKLLAVLTVVFAASAIVAACTGSSSSDQSSSSSASSAPADNGMSAATAAAAPAGKATPPIAVAKLKTIKVAAGSATAGKMVFDQNCASCHGAGGMNAGGPGPTLAGLGLKAGQVAFMVRNPAAIDPDSGMPKLPLTDKQLADVSAYVASLK